MNTRQRQSGMSIPGILVIMIMVGFFVMCAIRMAPPYFEYLSVKRYHSQDRHRIMRRKSERAADPAQD